MDPVLLKRSLCEILRALNLCGTVIRYEVEDAQAGTCFRMVIAYEATTSRGHYFDSAILHRVNSLPFIGRTTFTSRYTISQHMFNRPMVNGISIVETNALYARKGSSGMKCDNTDTSRGKEILHTVTSLTPRYRQPAFCFFNSYATVGGKRYHFQIISEF